MKQIIIYISLLIFSGLILPFYSNIPLKKATVAKIKEAGEATTPHREPTNNLLTPVYQDIAETLLPVLKIKNFL